MTDADDARSGPDSASPADSGGAGEGPRVRSAVRERRDPIDDAMTRLLAVDTTDRLRAATTHLVEAGGKRLRPALSLLVADALLDGAGDYRAVPVADRSETADLTAVAAAVEGVHTSTLVHDDIMDDDPARRGVASVHRAYDLGAGVLSGDLLLIRSLSAVADAAPPATAFPATRRLMAAYTDLCRGQALDVEFEDRSPADLSVEQYREMVELKTGALYGAAAALPAVALGRDRATVEALDRYGRRLGTAFQVRDDVLDLVGDPDALGRPPGSDLVERKATLVTIHAAAEGVAVDDLVGATRLADLDDEELASAVNRLRAAGSLDYADRVARDAAAAAVEALGVLPETDHRDRLEDAATYAVTRSR